MYIQLYVCGDAFSMLLDTLKPCVLFSIFMRCLYVTVVAYTTKHTVTATLYMYIVIYPTLHYFYLYIHVYMYIHVHIHVHVHTLPYCDVTVAYLRDFLN